MKISELILQLHEHMVQFGDMGCVFNRTVYPQVDTHTSNASIFVSVEHDNYRDSVDFKLYIEGE